MKAMIGAVAIAALGLTACNQSGGELALDAAASVDPTGIASELSYQAKEARQAQQDEALRQRGSDISQAGVSLQEVAQGRTDRPNLLGTIKGEVAAQRTQMVADATQRMATSVGWGVLGGGTSLITAAPGLAMQAANTAAMSAAMTSAEVQIGQSMVEIEAQRAAERIVPDQDRPSEARAILSIVEGPNGKSASWQNPQTGASGRVTIRHDHTAGGLRCRQVLQEWRSGGQSRQGTIPVCRQNGTWYDLS